MSYGLASSSKPKATPSRPILSTRTTWVPYLWQRMDMYQPLNVLNTSRPNISLSNTSTSLGKLIFNIAPLSICGLMFLPNPFRARLTIPKTTSWSLPLLLLPRFVPPRFFQLTNLLTVRWSPDPIGPRLHRGGVLRQFHSLLVRLYRSHRGVPVRPWRTWRGGRHYFHVASHHHLLP